MFIPYIKIHVYVHIYIYTHTHSYLYIMPRGAGLDPGSHEGHVLLQLPIHLEC